MYVALREIRSATGRFSLIAGVVLLLALLVAGLSSLTSGLSHQNISAVQALGSGRFAMADAGGATPDLERSTLSDEQLAAFRAADRGDVPIGLARIRVTDADGNSTSVVALGLDGQVGSLHAPAPGEVLVSTGATRDPAIGAESSLPVDGGRLAVAGSVGDLWYAHSPVIVTDLQTWHRLAPANGAASIVALGSDAGHASVAGATVVDAKGLVSAIPSHTAEQGSLSLMRGMLMVISALVVGAFFTVWGIQRARGVAVLKALGASTRTLVVDSLGQALIVLAIGVGGGVAVAAVLGFVVPDSVPYIVSASTTLVPGAILAVLGLVGAALALRPVLSADPTTALGALR